MALLAGRWRYSVCAGQLETSQRMVESRWRPGNRRVTGLAGSDEDFRLLRMARVRRAVVIVQVTGDARRACEIVVVILMAVVTGAGGHGVASAQREAS